MPGNQPGTPFNQSTMPQIKAADKSNLVALLVPFAKAVGRKADNNHTHSDYAKASHTHSSYAPASATTTNAVTAIPVAHSLVVASVSASASFKLASTPVAGREVHVIIKNTSSAAITITLPTSGGYSSDADSFSIPANGIGEVNAISDGTTIYLRSVS